MNPTLELLLGGNLQSDGDASEVADQAVNDPLMISQLLEGLSEPDDLVRGRTAHAVERISRLHPELVLDCLPQFVELAINDKVPMVRWHMAMIFPNLPLSATQLEEAISTLFQQLGDPSVFVAAWAIVSLTILGRRHASLRQAIIDKIRYLQDSPSIAIRSKVAKSVKCLEDESQPIPANWIKA